MRMAAAVTHDMMMNTRKVHTMATMEKEKTMVKGLGSIILLRHDLRLLPLDLRPLHPPAFTVSTNNHSHSKYQKLNHSVSRYKKKQRPHSCPLELYINSAPFHQAPPGQCLPQFLTMIRLITMTTIRIMLMKT
jgi:hypothetical protein